MPSRYWSKHTWNKTYGFIVNLLYIAFTSDAPFNRLCDSSLDEVVTRSSIPRLVYELHDLVNWEIGYIGSILVPGSPP